MSVVLCCPIYGTLFWPPRKTHTASHGSMCRSRTPAVATGSCSPQHWGASDGSCWGMDRWAPEQEQWLQDSFQPIHDQHRSVTLGTLFLMVDD